MSHFQWSPCVEMDSYNGIREVSVYTRHLSKRRIFLNGEIIQILNLEISWCLYEVVHPTLFESASSPLVCS